MTGLSFRRGLTGCASLLCSTNLRPPLALDGLAISGARMGGRTKSFYNPLPVRCAGGAGIQDRVRPVSVIELTSRRPQTQRTLLDWLRVEFGIGSKKLKRRSARRRRA